MPHVELDLLTLPEHLRLLSFCWDSCYLFFSFLCCFMCSIVYLFVFFIFSHGVVSLFSIYEFDCPSGIFPPSFKDILLLTFNTWSQWSLTLYFIGIITILIRASLMSLMKTKRASGVLNYNTDTFDNFLSLTFNTYSPPASIIIHFTEYINGAIYIELVYSSFTDRAFEIRTVHLYITYICYNKDMFKSNTWS